jgi:hypothetical protein
MRGPVRVYDANLPVSTFDYSHLPRSVSSFLKGEATRIRRQVGLTIINIGKGLLSAKRYLSHGEFLKWIEIELEMPARTAQAYMQVAQWAANKSAMVAHLPPSLLYVLASPSTPPAFVSNVLKKVEAGERVALSDLRAELRAIRSRRRAVPENSSDIAAPPQEEIEVEPVELSAGLLVTQAVSILARELSRDVFERVRDIMTSKEVSSDPTLGEKIAVAFAGVGMSAIYSMCLRDLSPQLGRSADYRENVSNVPTAGG